MKITHYEYRYRGAPHGVSPVTGNCEYSVLQSTTHANTARQWVHDIDRYTAHDCGVYAVTADGQAYKLEMEMSYGPIGYHTQDDWVTV